MNHLLKNKFTATLFLFFLSSSFVFAQTTLNVATYDQLVHAIRETRAASQKRVEQAVDQEKVREAWETGKLIQEHILLNKNRADYGKRVIAKLAGDLETSETELKYMLQFARTYPIRPSTGELPWGHYRELLSVNDAKLRDEITKEAGAKQWSQNELRRELKKRRLAVSELPEEKLEAKPGKLNTRRIVKAAGGIYKGELVVDLGFSSYYKPDQKWSLHEGGIVRVEKKESLYTLRQDLKFKDADLFTYQAEVIQVIDGDTFHASIDLGFGFMIVQKLRLRGLDAPEIESSEGREAKEFFAKLLAKKKGKILLRTVKSDKYDRYLADVWVGKTYLNQELLEKGLAVRVSE